MKLTKTALALVLGLSVSALAEDTQRVETVQLRAPVNSLKHVPIELAQAGDQNIDRSPASETQQLPKKPAGNLEPFTTVDVAMAEENASKVTYEKKSIPMNEFDGQIGIFWGASYKNVIRFVNFSADAGYRFFKEQPSLVTSLRLNYYSTSTTDAVFSAFINGGWHFDDSNSGFIAGAGLGYAFRAQGVALAGLAIDPFVSYDLPIADKWSAGFELNSQITFGSSTEFLVNGMALLRFWY